MDVVGHERGRGWRQPAIALAFEPQSRESILKCVIGANRTTPAAAARKRRIPRHDAGVVGNVTRPRGLHERR